MAIVENWLFDELKQRGTDYTNEAEVRLYDERMKRIRDIDGEVRDIIKTLDLKKDQMVLEIGCGTGNLAIGLSSHCEKVIAADVSAAMLEYAGRKAETGHHSNISFVHAGFLTYEHEGKPVDAVVTQIALHHLPDFWKLIALKRINLMMKDGGLLYLRDVVFSLKVEKYREGVEYWINRLKEEAGEDMAREAAAHVREEYSTFDWIMEEMLYRAGFYIEEADYQENFIAVYVCRKISGV